MIFIKEERTIQAPTHRHVLDKKVVRVYNNGETVIDVANYEHVKFSNPAPVTVTEIRGGQPGQTIKILGDGTTTLDHNSNIDRAGNASAVLLFKKTYTFTWFDTFWSEDI